MDFTLQTATGKYDLEGYVRLIGTDLLVAIWGGERPHIGAVAIALPRPSLKDPLKGSATVSVFCFLGHKEDELAKRAAEKLSAALQTSVTVTAGIHWDGITQAGIRQVLKNSEKLVELILDRMLQH